MHKGRAIATAEARATRMGHPYAVVSLGRGRYAVRPLAADVGGVMAVELPDPSSTAIGVAHPLPAGGFRALPALED